MEPLNEALMPMVIQLDHLRRQRKKQDLGQEGVRVVDADPPKPLQVTGPFCARCQDAGYLRANVPFGHPLFGKAVECECRLAKKKEAHRQLLREQSKIDQLAAFQDESFETFQFWRRGVGQAFQLAKQWAFAPEGWLVLEGPNGCGKTHLAVAIAKRCLWCNSPLCNGTRLARLPAGGL